MTALPVDVALTVAGDGLIGALRRAIADRRGHVHGPIVGDTGFVFELLSPDQATFAGRTDELALAWCQVYLIGEIGEIGEIGACGLPQAPACRSRRRAVRRSCPQASGALAIAIKSSDRSGRSSVSGQRYPVGVAAAGVPAAGVAIGSTPRRVPASVPVAIASKP